MLKVNEGSVRRVVTGHDHQGKAVVVDDQKFETAVIPSGDAAFALIWAEADLPVNNGTYVDGRELDAGLTIHSGSVIRIVDMLPGGESPFHRTNSIDYGIVLSGQVELELDDGEITLLRQGDIAVQRGTIHLWRNPSDSVICRIVFVLTQANPVQIDGKALPEIQP